MIKVFFKKVELINQDGLFAECLFIYAFASIYNYREGKRAIWLDKNKFILVDENNIKKIEKI